MILLSAVLLGLLLVAFRMAGGGVLLHPPPLRNFWLVYLAFLPQGLLFYTDRLSGAPELLFPAALVLSQALLIAFVLCNRHLVGVWLLGTGVALNFLVIVLNGGMMPVTPATLTELVPGSLLESWEIGSRVGKDIILPRAATRLWWLSDTLLLPSFLPYRVAFSLGDVLLAMGAFRLTASVARRVESSGMPALSNA
jgi:hypothetical protein